MYIITNIDESDAYDLVHNYYYTHHYDNEDSPRYYTRLELNAVRAAVAIVEDYDRLNNTITSIKVSTFAEDFIQVNLNDPTRCPSLERDYINDYYIALTFRRGERPHLLIKKDSPMLYLFTTECTPVTIPYSPYSDVPAAYDKD